MFFSSTAWASERINLAFNIDNNYVTYMLLTINSIFKNNVSDSQFHIYVVENDLNQKNKAKIKKFIEKNKQNVEFISISKEKLNVGESYYFCTPITNIAFARIFLPQLLPDIDKVLYLDSDLLVLADIKELYNKNISGYAMGMVTDFSDAYKIIKHEMQPYYNDGVILMDLEYMRKHHLTEKIVEYAKKNPGLVYADQDLFNNSVHKYIKKLDDEWNNQYYVYNKTGYTLTPESKILHYISSVKPWMTLPDKSYPERYLYLKYWFASEFRFYYISSLFNQIFKKYTPTGKDSYYCPDNKEIIPIAYTIDNNYWLYTLLSIDSILKNNKNSYQYHFYIIEDNLSDKNKKRMTKYISKHHQRIDFINIDTKNIDDGENLYQKTEQHKYISRIAMARILLPELLPYLDKVLYLDGDTLVTGDLSELYNIDMKNYPVAMVCDITETNEIPTYFNDGVILMNLKYFREHNITQIMTNYLKKKKVLPKMDQDLFNIILKNKIMILDHRWNNQYGYMSYDDGIIHYIGEYKPWLINLYRDEKKAYYKPYAILYDNYWNNSELKKYKLLNKIKQLPKICLDVYNNNKVKKIHEKNN